MDKIIYNTIDSNDVYAIMLTFGVIFKYFRLKRQDIQLLMKLRTFLAFMG